jgi:hypothetical protein
LTSELGLSIDLFLATRAGPRASYTSKSKQKESKRELKREKKKKKTSVSSKQPLSLNPFYRSVSTVLFAFLQPSLSLDQEPVRLSL